ncbi:hypothetical protein [Legionella maioricensis]|uniref:Endo-1,3-beta-glucanase btgC n=1 Tax=Legionella maioricensis TaxID=2896528 RepID=A0A9X2ID97_9GAMM|nr:hypothetical protein [Legionella maioricensis]MCL9685312.1 hypothetical protein [Legionella maioricensis]MCL9688567.1 hypothetical protein [Legionella maioricensis]
MQTMLKTTALLITLYSSASFAYGEFFNLQTKGMVFNIKTASVNGNYSNAGIKITSGQKIFCPGATGNGGHCIFPASYNASHNTIGIQGSAGPMTLEMCLNGIGQATCATYKTTLAPIRGINYDPAHSPAYLQAQQSNNQPGMAQSMTNDFQQIKRNGLTVVKTFISVASTFSGQQTNLAAIACPMGLKLMLGIYEFQPSDGCSDNSQCAQWTQGQVQSAISSVKNNPGCIVGIAVGNEDIYDYTFTVPNTQIQQRIATDIQTIQAALGSTVPVGTAQQDGALLALASNYPGNDPYGIIKRLNFVGANIYPFWSAQQPAAPSATEFSNRLQAVRNAYSTSNGLPNDVRVVVTEEGWASQGNIPPQNPNATLPQEITYYSYWLGRASQDNFDSYYFGFYDKVQPNNGNADNFFGLCTYTGASKSASLFACS